MIHAWIDGVGIYAPGLLGWEQAAVVLAGNALHTAADLPKLTPALLAPDVRRRTTDHIRLAVTVGEEAVRNAGVDGSGLWSVFATSDGDGLIMNHICEEVAKDKPEVSPTRFHNSVNNAPAGYWHMAVQSRAPSTSLGAHDASFAAGLLESVLQLQGEAPGVLYISHDTPLPEPLHEVRPIGSTFGLALVMTPVRSSRSLARIGIEIEPKLVPLTKVSNTSLEGMRTGNPTARSLPLLAAIAQRHATTVTVPYVNSQALRVEIEPA